MNRTMVAHTKAPDGIDIGRLPELLELKVAIYPFQERREFLIALGADFQCGGLKRGMGYCTALFWDGRSPDVGPRFVERTSGVNPKRHRNAGSNPHCDRMNIYV